VAVITSMLFHDLLEVQIWGSLPEAEESYFNFRFFRNDVLMNDSLQGFYVQSSQYIIGRDIQGLTVFYLDQEDDGEQLQSGDALVVEIAGITRDYANFMDNARREYRGSDPLFSGPPANIETNIRCTGPALSAIGLSGFFTATSRNRIGMRY
jgi:hypothetical protein